MIHSSTYQRNPATAGIPKRTTAIHPSLASNLTWFDSGAWRLPSGQALSEFALQAGFLVPHLFAAKGHSPSIGSLALARESGSEPSE
jgi:hypothetical protein